jgi:hypothetical protein
MKPTMPFDTSDSDAPGGRAGALSPGDVRQCLGEVSDELVSRILATGATADELAAAAREIEMGGGDEPSEMDERIQELCRLIADELGDELWDDETV